MGFPLLALVVTALVCQAEGADDPSVLTKKFQMAGRKVRRRPIQHNTMFSMHPELLSTLGMCYVLRQHNLCYCTAVCVLNSSLSSPHSPPCVHAQVVMMSRVVTAIKNYKAEGGWEGCGSSKQKRALAKAVLAKVNVARSSSGMPTLTLVEVINVKQQVVQGTKYDLCLGTKTTDGDVVEFSAQVRLLHPNPKPQPFARCNA